MTPILLLLAGIFAADIDVNKTMLTSMTAHGNVTATKLVYGKQGVVIPTLTADPSSTVDGQMWLLTSGDKAGTASYQYGGQILPSESTVKTVYRVNVGGSIKTLKFED